MNSQPSWREQMGELLTAMGTFLLRGESNIAREPAAPLEKPPVGSTTPELANAAIFRGLYSHVARQLGVSPQHVRQVDRGISTSQRVSEAIAREAQRRRCVLEKRSGSKTVSAPSGEPEQAGSNSFSKPLREEFADAAWEQAVAAARAETARVRAEEARARDLAFYEDLVLALASGRFPAAKDLDGLVARMRLCDLRAGRKLTEKAEIVAAAERLAERGLISLKNGKVSLIAKAEVQR